jgi:hypothetical protein
MNPTIRYAAEDDFVRDVEVDDKAERDPLFPYKLIVQGISLSTFCAGTHLRWVSRSSPWPNVLGKPSRIQCCGARPGFWFQGI